MATNRLTTREAADLLACTMIEAVALLRAAGVPSTRCGRMFLWDADAVERLRQRLREKGEAAPSGGAR